MNVILTVAFKNLPKISLPNTCELPHEGSHFGFCIQRHLQCTDIPPEGRRHVLDVIYQVFQERIYHDDVDISKTNVAYDRTHIRVK